jgi:histidyl-tRNA synthetase
MAKEKLSTDPYKGTRDFYPEDWAFEKWLFEIMRKTAESFGYMEYNASPLEQAELYASKTSEEIVNEQTYTFEDRGGRKVTLRPEMTPTLARMVSANRRNLGFPLRWFSIPNVFRYEQPQRGRLREHYQFNVDCFGISGIEAEIELISIAHQLMLNLGAKESDFEIRINSRVKLAEAIKSTLKDQNDLSKAMRLLDKKSKLSADEFEVAWNEIANDKLGEITESDELNIINSHLKNIGVNNVKFDPYLTRGFDYYTDIVFEIFDTNEENRRSLFGGGRYNELLSIFGEEPIPAIGFGMGDVTAKDFLETHNLIPKYSPSIDLMICTTGDSDITFINQTANLWRKDGVQVAVNWTRNKIGDQIKSAEKQKIPYIVVIGNSEKESGNFTLKKY